MKIEELKEDLGFARFIAKGAYMALVKLREGQNLCPAIIVERLARETPSQVAILFEDERITYAELDAQASRVAHALAARGLKSGDVVGLVMDNRPEYITTVLAVNKLGGVTALVNNQLKDAPLEHALRIAKPTFLVVGSEHVEKVAALGANLPVATDKVAYVTDRASITAFPGGFDLLAASAGLSSNGFASTASIDIGAPFVYIYTSGTTGLPKAALVKGHRFFRAGWLFGQNVMGITPKDVVYSSGLPLYHSSGLILGWAATISGGATFCLRRKFSASGHWDDCDRYGVTIFTYIGEMCRYLANAPKHPKEQGHKVRCIMGAGLRPDVWEGFQKRFAIPMIYEFYGATEGNVGIVNIDGKPGMMGRLMPGHVVIKADPDTGKPVLDASGRATKVAPGEAGLLMGKISAQNAFDGYVDSGKNASKIVRNAFGDGADYFDTGDLVLLHPRGFVSFRDRMGDTFRWKAENVSTNEVQEVLNCCEGVHETNVYGVEVVGQDGRAGMASVVAGEGFDLVRFAEHVAAKLPAYSRPLFIRIAPEMATTGTFKHVKTNLREQGFDPTKVEDALYFLEEGKRYVALDVELHTRIVRGEIRL
jgi:acyl-CoA synthetase (AMP-forming)/AMP-acid ligase II